MKDQTKIIVGLLAGAAVITVVGLLLTTDKGTEIKEEITDYLADLVSSVKSKAQATADNAIKTARSVVKHKVNEAAEAISAN